ncbi:MAG: efflux RND transporter periplasmic adaptor subunit [Planctomycetota bacterium]
MPQATPPPGVPSRTARPAGFRPIAAAIPLAALLSACSSQEPPPPPPPPAVIVQSPEVRDVTSYYRYTGNMAAVESVEVRARVTGELQSKHFTASTNVEAGDLLFVIEPAPFEAEVAAADAQVEQARAALELAEIEKQRIDQAFERNAATEQERLRADATVKQRVAELKGAQAELRQANIQLSYTQIKAPIAGRVDRELVDVGNLVSGTQGTLLTTVTQLDPIHAYFDVSERIVLEYLERGRNGGVGEEAEPPPLEIARASDPDGTFPFTGFVDFVAPRVDNQTGTIQVRGLFDNGDDALFPGLFVRVRAPYDTIQGAVVVPQDAVGTDLAGDFVLIVGDGDIVQRIGVTLGEPNDDGTVTVLTGLAGSERIIVEGLQKARPGNPVSPTPHDTPAPTDNPPIDNPPTDNPPIDNTPIDNPVTEAES